MTPPQMWTSGISHEPPEELAKLVYPELVEARQAARAAALEQAAAAEAAREAAVAAHVEAELDRWEDLQRMRALALPAAAPAAAPVYRSPAEVQAVVDREMAAMREAYLRR